MMGDEGLAAIVTEAFLADMPRQIEGLRAFLEQGDAQGSGRQAHSIKGAAAAVGGERLRATAREIEQAADLGDLCAAQAGMDELEKQFFLLKQAMQL